MDALCKQQNARSGDPRWLYQGSAVWLEEHEFCKFNSGLQDTMSFEMLNGTMVSAMLAVWKRTKLISEWNEPDGVLTSKHAKFGRTKRNCQVVCSPQQLVKHFLHRDTSKQLWSSRRGEADVLMARARSERDPLQAVDGCSSTLWPNRARTCLFRHDLLMSSCRDAFVSHFIEPALADSLEANKKMQPSPLQ